MEAAQPTHQRKKLINTLLYMRAINYKSDFDFIPKLKDRNGKEVRFPDCDWEAVLWVSNKANNYKVSRKGEQYTNCFVEENGDVHFVVNGHHLGIGVLKWDLHVALPNEIYPDGLQHLCWPESLDIELVAGAGDCPTTAELEAMLPYIKGEPFTYDDFTPEQIAELQKPATDAAASVSELETNIQETEALRKDAEQTRISNENSRTSAENDRVRDENIRKANETSRQSDETSRQSNETARVEAETARAEEFATWENEIDSKAERSELSNVLAESTDDGVILKERGTGEVMYPQTLASLVHTSDGGNVDEGLEKAKFALFVDMWNQAWGNKGKYDPVNAPDVNHPFMGNEIWMTYEEAIAVMHHSVIYAPSQQHLYAHKYPPCRTLLPTMTYGNAEEYNGTYGYCNKLETIRIRGGYGGESVGIKNAQSAFMACTVLREVFGILDLAQCSTPQTPAHKATNLEGLYISHLHVDLNMATNPKWRLDCVEFVVENATNTPPITITVHPDVYAKLTDELIALAAEKQITFATT